MTINLNNVSLLSISQEPIKFDSDLSFSNQKKISVSGLLIDLNNDSGVKNIFQETNGLIEVNTDALGSINIPLGEIIINGISYGEGYIDSFEVVGEQIQVAEYSASISITEAGNLSSIVLSQNELTPTTTSIYSELNFIESSLTNEDLKYVSSFDESFSFQVSDSNSLSINHQVSCSFEYRKSLISSRKDVWSNSSIQQSKLVKLKNKGKKSIKVLAGESSNFNIYLSPKNNGDPQKYVLFFDYLGQNASSWGASSVDFGSESIALSDKGGRKKIELNITATSRVSINLNANSLNETFFDNFKLFKADELPIEKSRTLANFILNNSPNYSIIQTEHEGRFKNLNLFENKVQEESFDEINLTYSVSRSINHDVLSPSDDYSIKKTLDLVLSAEGFIQVVEKSEIKLLKDKSEANLRSVLSSIESGGYARSLSCVTNYNSKLKGECSTPTHTLTPGLYLHSI
jgi:hypothetical protein